MTEDEAKTKWCPFARVGAIQSEMSPINRDYGQGLFDRTMCIGSQCMAWRWLDQQTYATAMDWVHAEAGRRLEDFKPRNPTKGFCGLAGRP